MAVELQVCKNDLQNTRILATESGRIAETTAATLANLAARQQLLAAMQAPAGQQVKANSVFTVRFDFGSTRVAIPPDIAAALVEDAKASPLVLLRGRTDGTTDAPAESRIARERAAAVRDYLVAAGVDPARIRATYQPAGDHVADNASAGRPRPEPPRRDRAVPRAAGRTERAPPSPSPEPPPNPPSRGRHGCRQLPRPPGQHQPRAAPSSPPTAPPWPSSGSRRRADTAGERYELRDPFAEVTYRANTFPEMVAKADQLGSTPLRRGGRGRQAHADPEGRWRVATRAAAPGGARAAPGPGAGARRGARGHERGPDARRRQGARRSPSRSMPRPSPRSTPRPSAPRSSPASKPR